MIYFNTNSYFKLIVAIKILNVFQRQVRADSYVSESKSIGQYCWSSNECFNSHCLKQNESQKHGTCQCLTGYIETDKWIQCVQPRNYGQPCEYSEQCQHFDNNTVCDTELGHFLLKCLCSDYHRFSPEVMRCQWCDHNECRRSRQKFMSGLPYSTDKYNLWYHNVDRRLIGIWASLLIMAIPISLFVFMLGIRYTRYLFGFNRSSQNRFNGSINFDVSHELEMRVSIPPELIRVELPPSYEDCAKSNQLPSYEEAVLMPIESVNILNS